MNDFFTLIKHWRVSTGILIIIILVIFNADRIPFIRTDSVVRTDYNAVATNFISSNGFIAKKLGKVTRISHFGKGGSGGKESYNVFRVVGEETSGVLTMTLTRTEKNEWVVTLAELSVSGTVFEVPLSRTIGNKWRLFKW